MQVTCIRVLLSNIGHPCLGCPRSVHVREVMFSGGHVPQSSSQVISMKYIILLKIP